MPLPTARRVLLASTALTTLVLASGMSIQPAAALDGTWLLTPFNNDFNFGPNWDGGSLPTGTASFGTSRTTDITITSSATLGEIVLNPGASNYTFSTTNQTVTLNGLGIVINGGSATFNMTGGFFVAMSFLNSSTAGTATIRGSGLSFFGNSSAAFADITNDAVTLRDNATLGFATVNNQGGLLLLESSTAGSANIDNHGTVDFRNASSAGSAAFTSRSGGSMTFWDSSTAEISTITNERGSTVSFRDQSTGGNATIINDGTVDFSNSTGLANDRRLSAGSIAGSGNYILGANELTVGGNNSSTTVSGVISGTGSLVKTGIGTLTLSGDNTYSGGTTISDGVLKIGDGGTSGSITGNVTNNAALIVDRSDALSLGGVISGTGSVEKRGAGMLTLTGDNTYSGGTTIAAGALKIGDGGTTGSVTGNITDNAALIVDRSNAVSLGGVISGSGSVEKRGAGTLTLTGTNTYAGGTTITGGTLSVAADVNLGNAAGALTFNGGTLQVTGTTFTSTARTINWGAGGGGFDIADAGNTFTVSQALGGTGGLTKSGVGALVLTGTNTYTGGTTISGGTLQLGTGSSAGTIRGAVNVGAAGTFAIYNADTTGITNVTNAGSTSFFINSSAGTAAITNDGSLYFREASTAGGSTITNTNSLSFYADAKAGTASIDNQRYGWLSFAEGSSADHAHITSRGRVWFVQAAKAGAALIENMSGDVNFLDGSSAENATIINDDRVLFRFGATAGSATIVNNASLTFYQGGTGGNATIVNNAGGTVDFSGSTGPNRDNKLSAGSIAGAGNYLLGSDELTVGGNNTSTEVSGIISGTGGALVKTGTGTLLLSGVNTYTGATTVNGGTLSVNGSITSSSGVIVNAGGTLGGTGQLPDVIVNAGGNLAPGNSIGTITVNGNLAFGAGSFYTVEVSPGAADRTNVIGAATLTGATVRAAALPGSFRQQTYTILNATGGLGGTTFAGLNVTGSFAPARNPHLTYDANNAYLVLDPGTLPLGQGATRDQTNVANSINRAVEAGGAPPAGFDTLLNMSSDAAGRALDQLSGESGTQAQTGAFQLGNSFLALLSDVFGIRRDDGAAPLGYAAERPGAPSVGRSAFAALDKAPAAYAPRWDLWGTAFGGGNNVSGDPAGTGSRDAFTRAGAVAAGTDYRFTANSLVGFSLAGGSMNWSVIGSGSGASDVFMAGVYGKHSSGPAYVAAAASYANYWMSTSRTVTVAGLDQLKANFNAESFGGRIETGYRLPARFLNVSWTPYGAIQAQNFRTPDYSEAAAVGSNQFALRYAGRTATAVRAEAGFNVDRLIAIDRGSELSLFGRTAYAHDSISNPVVAANFAVLGPTGGFTTFGAQPSQNLLLSSGGAEWRLASGVSFMLKADSEWGERSRTYSGTGRIRYTW